MIGVIKKEKKRVFISLLVSTIASMKNAGRARKGNVVSLLSALFLAVFTFAPVQAQTAPPALFFSDLESGPNSGGENNNGAYVTIYGTNFGTSQGSSSVTVGGGQVARYVIWGTPYLWYQKITFQLGPNVKTGTIQVKTSAGSSNTLPFTVRNGNIFFVSPSGSDSNPGTVSQPFQSLTHARDALKPGDIVYARTGNWASIENFGAVLIIWPENSGTLGNPKALVAYPGETPSIINTSAERGIFFLGHEASRSAGSDYWTIAGFKLEVLGACIYSSGAGNSNYLRVIGTDQKQHENGAAMYVDHPVTNNRVLGNNIHNNGDGGISKAYSLYYGGGFGDGPQTDIEIGWNDLHDNPRGKGLQVYGHGTGDTISKLRVHDNRFYNNCMSGAVLGGSDGNVPLIQDLAFYNNLVYNNGSCDPDYPYDGIEIQNQSNGGSTGGVFQVYNNTFYNNGDPGRNSGYSVRVDPNIGSLTFSNNIVYAISPTMTYFVFDGNAASLVSGTNNLYFNGGTPPSRTAGNITGDPKFVNAAGGDFHLLAGSPAIDAGVTSSGLTSDIFGITRPQGAANDIGAAEYYKGSSVGALINRCDLNSDGVVDQLDIQLAVNQAIQSSVCGSADLQGTGVCNVVDVQRVVNASLGQACRVGP